MNIGIVGAGYVGLVSGIGFAQLGHEVNISDIDTAKIEMLNCGQAPIFEANINDALKPLVGKRLRATSNVAEMISKSSVVFLCVGTPCDDNTMQLGMLKQAVADIGTAIASRNDYPIVVIKSTVLPGTTEKVILPILEDKSGGKLGKRFGVVVNPEFLSEGNALNDFMYPSRIVIGEFDPKDGDITARLYEGIHAPILRVNPKTAEMIKCASNAALAAKLSFINEIGDMCKQIGIDVYEVAKGVGLDPRISPHFFKAGLGFGGSCLPKDVRALVTWSKELQCQSPLLESVLQVNEGRSRKLVELAEKKLGLLRGKTAAILGLAFKPGTDDIRETPSLKVISELLKRGVSVKVYDPVAEPNARAILGTTVEFADSTEEIIKDAELVFILTEWDEFCDPALYRGKKVFAGRRVFEPDEASTFDCEGLCW